MVLHLTRQYFPEGTNGILKCEDRFICYTIELPWRNNYKNISCIPEGKYFIKQRYSAKFKDHFEIVGVDRRTLILFHPANNALKELNGCIAPVSKLSGAGVGLLSKIAFEKLRRVIKETLQGKQTVLLIINT